MAIERTTNPETIIANKKRRRRRRVGLIYDDRMCKHDTPYQEDHPECPNRIRAIWELLNSSGLVKRCVVLDGKVAEDSHLALVHKKTHINLIKNISSKTPKSKRNRVADKYDSVYFNEGSSEAALLAAGSVVEVTDKVAKGELDSAFAIVRPPGHHAEEAEPMGFCLYNNVAVAASFLLNERQELGIKKILIVDWDVHHGNGAQNMFYDDPRVLVFSVHRHEGGTFYPSGNDGSYIMTGEGPGAGYNINVPWENGRCGDADYLAVWDHILLPVASEFGPGIVIVAAGFDAAKDDPLGGCCVSPYGYSVMLHALMKFAKGKIVLALEGGYNLNSIAKSAKACVEVLLKRKPVKGSLEAYPFESTWRVIQDVRRELSAYWPELAMALPDSVISKTTAQIDISSSDYEGEGENESHCLPEEIQSVRDVLQPFKHLKVNGDGQANEPCHCWLHGDQSLAKFNIYDETEVTTTTEVLDKKNKKKKCCIKEKVSRKKARLEECKGLIAAEGDQNLHVGGGLPKTNQPEIPIPQTRVVDDEDHGVPCSSTNDGEGSAPKFWKSKEAFQSWKDAKRAQLDLECEMVEDYLVMEEALKQSSELLKNKDSEFSCQLEVERKKQVDEAIARDNAHAAEIAKLKAQAGALEAQVEMVQADRATLQTQNAELGKKWRLTKSELKMSKANAKDLRKSLKAIDRELSQSGPVLMKNSVVSFLKSYAFRVIRGNIGLEAYRDGYKLALDQQKVKHRLVDGEPLVAIEQVGLDEQWRNADKFATGNDPILPCAFDEFIALDLDKLEESFPGTTVDCGSESLFPITFSVLNRLGLHNQELRPSPQFACSISAVPPIPSNSCPGDDENAQS